MLRLLLTISILLATTVAVAQPKPTGKARARKNITITPEREAAVFKFVEQHHPELAGLLERLKENQAKAYQRAIRELYTVSERLAGLQDNDEDRYDLELKAWKLRSRIQLLSAKLTMGDDEQLEQQLKQTLGEQYDVRREIMQLEQGRLGDRLKKLENELADHASRRDEAIDKRFQQLTSGNAKPRAGAVRKLDKTTKSTKTTKDQSTRAKP